MFRVATAADVGCVDATLLINKIHKWVQKSQELDFPSLWQNAASAKVKHLCAVESRNYFDKKNFPWNSFGVQKRRAFNCLASIMWALISAWIILSLRELSARWPQTYGMHRTVCLSDNRLNSDLSGCRKWFARWWFFRMTRKFVRAPVEWGCSADHWYKGWHL